MKKRHSLFLLLCIVISTRVYAEIRLKIETSKPTYQQCEMVMLTFTVDNRTSHSIRINAIQPWQCCMKVIIKNASGNLFPISSWTHPANVRYNLAAKESLKETCGLLPEHSVAPTTIIRPHWPTTNFFPVGKYTIQAEYESGVGKVVSNTVNFEVVGPTGGEKEALTSFVAAVQRQFENDNVGSALSLKAVADKYPQSVYAPMALYEIVQVYQFRDKKKAIDAAVYLIEKYPDTYSARDALSFAVGRLSSRQQHELLQSTIRKFPNTIVGTSAVKTLRALGEQK